MSAPSPPHHILVALSAALLLAFISPARAADVATLLPAGWNPKAAADEVLARLVRVSAAQVRGAHDAEFVCIGDRAYVVEHDNDVAPGHGAGKAMYCVLTVVNLKTLEVEKTHLLAKAGQAFTNVTLPDVEMFVPRIIRKDEHTLRCYFCSQPAKEQAVTWYRDFDLRTQAFADSIHKAKLKTAAGVFDMEPRHFYADAAAKGFAKPAVNRGLYIFDSFKEFDGRRYVALNDFEGKQNALAVLLDDFATFEIVGHYNEPQSEQLSESAVNRLPDGTWMAICRNDRGNYHFTTSKDGKTWSVGEPRPFVPNGLNSKPTFDRFGGVYYLGWQENTKVGGCSRSVFNVDVSRDGTTWERKYRFESPHSFQYPTFHEHEGTIWLSVTQSDNEGSSDRIMFGKLEYGAQAGTRAGGSSPATSAAKPDRGVDALPARKVFAHYMVCCPTVGSSATLDDYKREIEEAQKRGVDGFALNCGNWEKREPHYKARTLLMYEAAKQLGTGFQLFVSLDGEAMAELQDVVRALKDHPNQFCHDGRPVLSTFGGQGGDDHAGGRNLIRAAHDEGTFFVPYYYPRPNITELPTETHVAQLTRDFPDLDGYFYFGGAGTGEQIAHCNTIHAKAWLGLGKVFMAGITPSYRANGGNFRCFETRGFEGMAREWESAIHSGATWVELVTWNDWNESSYLSPFGEPADTSLWKGHFGPKMLSHVAYLDASRHYIEWFKTSTPPVIIDDRLFYFYRLHPASVPVTVNAADESKGRGRPQGADALLDHLFVTTFLAAPAQLTLHSGATSQTFDVPAGVHHVSMPFAPGTQRFVLQRNGASIFDKTGEHEISATDGASRFNTFSGSATR
jgi:hypothetical protein